MVENCKAVGASQPLCLYLDNADDYLVNGIYLNVCHSIALGRQSNCTSGKQVVYCSVSQCMLFRCKCVNCCASSWTGSAACLGEADSAAAPWKTCSVGCDTVTLALTPLPARFHVVVVQLRPVPVCLPHLLFSKWSLFLCYVPNSGLLLTLQIKK